MIHVGFLVSHSIQIEVIYWAILASYLEMIAVDIKFAVGYLSEGFEAFSTTTFSYLALIFS